MYKAKVYVHLKKSVFDPQGETVLSALHSMDFNSAKTVRVGRYFEITLESRSANDAKAEVTKMCDRLLVNPVIEDYTFDLEEC
jgi:phosphoribosylformylglycinamidine synthase subunit PurS